MSTTFPAADTPSEMRAYISDALGQLADVARLIGDRRLETSMRLLALEVEVACGRNPSRAPDAC